MSDLTPDWLEEFQPSSYEVMEKLLAPDDFNFVLGEPGYDPSIRRNLRRARLKVFRGYLNRLISDFNRLHRFAVLMVARTDVDRSALMVRLLKLRLQFSLSVLRVEFSYALCCLGVQSMSLGDLLTRFNAMSEQLVPVPKANLTLG